MSSSKMPNRYMHKHKVITLAKSIMIYGSGDILQKIASFLLIPLYTAFLSPSDFGVVALTGTLVSLLSIIHLLGLDAGVLRYYYDFEEDLFKHYLKIVYIFLILFGIIISIILIYDASFFSRLIFKQAGFDKFITLAALTFFSMNIVNLFMNLWISKQESVKYSFFSLFNFLLIASSIIYFVVHKREGAYGQVKGMAMGWAVLLIIYSIMIIKYLRTEHGETEHKSSLRYLNESLKYGMPFLPHIMMVWFFSGVDILVLNYMCSLEEVGIFSLGARVGMVMFFITTAINRAWTPFFFALSKEKADDVKLTKMFTYIIAAMVAILLFLVLFYREILMLMVNEKYMRSFSIMPLFFLAYFFNGLYFTFVAPILYNKKTLYMPLISLITLIFYGGCLYVLVKFFGIYGAAISSVMTYFLRFVLAYYFSSRDFNFDLEISRLVKLIGISGAVMLLSLTVHFHMPALQILSKLMLLLLTFLLLWISGFLSEGELRTIKEFAEKLRQMKA